MVALGSGSAARRVRRLRAPESRGLVIFCHGLGLHADKFTPLYGLVNRLGHDVVTFDAPGHGDAEGFVLDSATVDQAAAAAISVYARHAHERPVLLGTGCFGGFLMRRIIAAARGSDWVPPAIFYSVDYIRLPAPLLRGLQHDRVLRLLDRFRPGYDHRRLTHASVDDADFIAGDPAAWTRFPLGMGLKLAHETNAFYDGLGDDEPPHAFIVGSDDRLSHLPPVRRAGRRQPDFRVWEVAGGHMHLHRDRPEVQARFETALAEALAFVTTRAGARGLPDGLPAASLPAPPEVAPAGPRGQARLLRQLMVDPVGLVEELQARHGSLFTVRIPFDITPPFTFLTTREGYASVLGLDPAVGRNGPVIDRVPALAHWTPRSDPSPEHLQELLLTGRRHIGRLLRGLPSATIDARLRARVAHHVAQWPATLDLADRLVTLIHDSCARLVLGDALVDALGPGMLDEVRTVVNAVDAARAVTALTPAGRLLPEARAAAALARRLRRAARDPQLQATPTLAGLRAEHPSLPEDDLVWMLFFALWNATIYMGTYGTWSFLDLLAQPGAVAALDAAPDRRAHLVGGILETMRLNPISWQLRALARPVEVTSGGRAHRVPAGHFLTVFSHGLNRDPAVYPAPLRWDPGRYAAGAPLPLLFGTGPFACVAQFFVKQVLATIHDTLLGTVSLRLEGPLPPRMSRVHLLYPSVPVVATRG